MAEPLEIYQKLFRAFETGTNKEEDELVRSLRHRFRIPPDADPVAHLSQSRVRPGTVFREVANHLGPFSAMLREIYTFLADYRTTMSQKADQFNLKYADLKDQLSFPLDSFPKTLVDALVSGEADLLTFTPQARDPVASHSNQDLALSVIAEADLFGYLRSAMRSDAPEADRFLKKVGGHLQRLYDRAATLSRACRAHLRANIVEREIYTYFWTDEMLPQLSQDERALGSNGFWLTALELFLLDWEEWKGGRLRKDNFRRFASLEDWTLKQIDDFQLRWSALFPVRRVETQVWTKVIDEVILPFWRHRWRLYEVWALLLVLRQAPAGVEVHPALVRREDNPSAWDWPMSYGIAHEPVARFVGTSFTLNVYFQHLTEHLLGHGNGHVEPDIRIKTADSSTADRFILELKDRHLCSLSHIRQVARTYAEGTTARRICIANYGSVRSKKYRNAVTLLPIASKTAMLASDFRPGQAHPEVLQAIRETIQEEQDQHAYDLLVDVSGSTLVFDVPHEVSDLVEQLGRPNRIFAVGDELVAHEGSYADLPGVMAGGTDLVAVLARYFSAKNSLKRVVVLTDEDGAKQVADSSYGGSVCVIHMTRPNPEEY